MRVYYPVTLFLIIIFSSCHTTQNTSAEFPSDNTTISTNETAQKTIANLDNIALNTYPIENSFQIAAITPKLQFENEEERFALMNAAGQISIYYGAYVSYGKVINENVIGTVQSQAVDVQYDKELALTFLDRLEILKVNRGKDYFATLIKMEGASLPAYPVIELNPTEKPRWINNPPNFDGFITGVGVSGRRKSVFESWEMADKLAMAEIANSISTNIKAGTATIERSSESSGASASAMKSQTVSDVHVKGLYILSRWREPDSSYYYSLAISGKP